MCHLMNRAKLLLFDDDNCSLRCFSAIVLHTCCCCAETRGFQSQAIIGNTTPFKEAFFITAAPFGDDQLMTSTRVRLGVHQVADWPH